MQTNAWIKIIRLLENLSFFDVKLFRRFQKHSAEEQVFLARSSHQRCSMKKGVFRNFTKFTAKHLRQSLFFNTEHLQTTASALLLLFLSHGNHLFLVRKIMVSWVCFWIIGVSIFGVILVCIFPHSDWIQTRISSNMDTFYAVFILKVA